MKISKVLLILSLMAFTASLSFAQEQEVLEGQDLNAAIDFVIGGGATTLVLATDGGVYYLNPFEVSVPMTIKAKPGLAVKPTIVAKNCAKEQLISVKEDLMLDGIVINGLDPATSTYDSVRYVIHVSAIETDPNPMPNLIVKNCEITNVYRYGDPEFSADGNILNITTGGRTGAMLFENNIFSNTGDEALRAINTHKDPVALGGVFATSFEVRNCTFSNIRGTGIKIEGDSDSTNADPQVVMENLTFDGCQTRVIWHRQMYGTIVRNILVTNTIKGNDFWAGAKALITVQGLGTTVSNVDTFNVTGIRANGDTVDVSYGVIVAEEGTNTGTKLLSTIDWTTLYNFDPGYADAASGDFTYSQTSPILSLGHDGLAIGDRKWAGMPSTGVEQEVLEGQDLNAAIDFVIGGGATTLVLATDGGVYYLNPFEVSVPMTIKAKPGLAVKPTIVAKNCAKEQLISVKEDLMLDGIVINGLDPATSTYDSVRYVIHVSAIETDPNPMPNLIVKNCEITNVYRYGDPEFSADGNILNITTGGRTGAMLFENNIFSNTGDEALRAINTHKDPVALGGVFATSFEVRNCTFSNIRGTGIKIEGDSDSTNADPQVVMENLTFDGCQTRVIWHRQMYGTIVRNILVTNTIKGNDFWAGAKALITVQGLGTTVSNVDTFNVTGIRANGDTVDVSYGVIVAEEGTNTGTKLLSTIDWTTLYNFDPGYADAASGDFTYSQTSPILSLGHDGLAIGDRKWAGQLGGPVSVESDLSSIPSDYNLSQNYPNPFNPSTQIQFSIPVSGNFTLKVFNILGQEVAELINGQLAAGSHTVNFDASRLSTGVYFYNFNGENFNQTRKMLLMK